MNGIRLDNTMDWILLVAALVMSLALFTFLMRVVSAAIVPLIVIAIVVLVLQFAFGIAPDEIWREVVHLWQGIGQKIGLE